MAAVKGRGVADIEMPHEGGQIPRGRLHDQMKVVGHQHVGVNPDIVYLA